MNNSRKLITLIGAFILSSALLGVELYVTNLEVHAEEVSITQQLHEVINEVANTAKNAADQEIEAQKEEERRQREAEEQAEKERQEELKRVEQSVSSNIEELIYNACVKYGIEYKLALAIARLETGHFTSAAYVYYNNPGGLSINEVPIAYATKAEGVDAFVSNLVSYYEAGLTTPETIAPVYCPPNASKWATMIRSLMY